MQKNLLLAIVLSMLILMFFQNKNSKYMAVKRTVGENGQIVRNIDIKKSPEQSIKVDKKSTKEQSRLVKEKIEDRSIAILNDNIKIGISSLDSGIKSIYLKDKKGISLELVQQMNLPYAMSINENFANIWSFESISNSEVTAKNQTDDMEYIRNYKLDGNTILVNTKILNKTDQKREINFEQAWYKGLGISSDLKKENPIDNRVYARIDDKVFNNMESSEITGKISWAGVLNRYFVAVFLDIDKRLNNVSIDMAKKASGCSRRLSSSDPASAQYPSLVLNASLQVDKFAQEEILQKIYVGPKEYKILKSLAMDLDKILSLGIFGGLSRVFLNILINLNSITRNYGIAIILLTLMLQIILFPLTSKSYKSMNAMKELQPKINDMRAKFKNDSQRLNQEMMELYKRHKVNPFGGCMPILLQMPIFISLFTMLRGAAELRYAGFLWIKDLAGADVLFASIPAIKNIPFIGSAGPLPILMGAAMFLQQKFTSSSVDSTQKTMMYMMPIMFTFMFMKFPSGLVLYWLSNSIFTFTIQYYISKKSK